MKTDAFRFVLYLVLMDIPFGHLLSAEGQDCSGCAIENYWCNIDPVGYSQVSVSAVQQGRISCSIPNQTGQDILLFNHYGDDVRTDPLLSNYIQQFPVSVNSIENVRIYSFNISWSGDSTVQDKFRVLQCIGIFHGTTQTCKTSVVNIQFENSQGTTLSATTASSTQQASTTDSSSPETDSSAVVTKTSTAGCIYNINNNLIQTPMNRAAGQTHCTTLLLLTSVTTLLLSLLTVL